MIFIAKELSEETKKKRQLTWYNKAIEKAKNEIGKKYGRLTITGIDYEKTYDSYFNKSYNRVFVTTECECGKIPPSNQLKSIQSGHIKSCGCIKFNNPLNMKDLTGKKFGRLTVIGRDFERDKKEYENGRRSGNVHWLCQCDCGNPELSSVTGYQLESGHTQSCGCYASEQIAKRNKLYSTKMNPFQNNGDGTITLFDDNGEQCLIDEEDYDIVRNWYWRKNEKRGSKEKGYWTTNSKIDDEYNKSTIPIQQIIAEIKYEGYENIVPDHLSRNTDDNRKCNIKLKTNKDNSHNRGLSKRNTSGKTGVSFNKQAGKWVAYIMVDYKRIHLGRFDTFEEAVKIRKEAESKYGFTCDDIVADYDDNSEVSA